MRFTTGLPRAAMLVALWVAVSLVAAVAAAQPALQGEELRTHLLDLADRVVFSERCGECHAAEFDVWEQTPHATGFDTLHTTDRAKEVYRALGLRLIKRGTEETTPACLQCHYTPEVRRDTLRAGAGVTCESCHGPARDWVGVHNSYGVAERDFQQALLLETPEHREQRIADSRAAGMRRPSDLYDVAANCFGCHTVPNEALVNVAGHTTGSDFELVSWVEEIRHNFLESYKTADGRTNAERTPEHKRMMYVVGRALDLEYSLRGVAAATDGDELYFAAMSDRVGAAIDELFYLNDVVPIPAVADIIGVWEGVELKPNHAPALLTAAEAVQTATRAFIADTDPATLAAVDPLWNPELDPPRITSAPEPEPTFARVTEVGLDSSEGAAGEARDDPSRGGAAVPAPGATPAGEPAPIPVGTDVAAPAVPRYEIFSRPPWRAPPEHDFVKVPCGRCHTQQQSWWQKDPHKGTADPLRNGEPEAIRIATRYGIDPANMARGDQTCMWCHGTITSAPSRKVRSGVGCQRCHGAGADYLEPHETVGYDASVALGLTPLKTAAARAESCAGCHYITDPGLIAAGHATGEAFDIAERMAAIEHWGTGFGRDQDDPMTTGQLQAAHDAVLAERGPPPDVEPIPDAPPPVAVADGGLTAAPPATGVAETLVAEAPAGGPAVASGGARSGAAPSPRGRTPVPRSRVSASRPPVVDNPGLGGLELDAASSPEEILLGLKARLEALYRALGRAPGP